MGKCLGLIFEMIFHGLTLEMLRYNVCSCIFNVSVENFQLGSDLFFGYRRHDFLEELL